MTFKLAETSHLKSRRSVPYVANDLDRKADVEMWLVVKALVAMYEAVVRTAGNFGAV